MAHLGKIAFVDEDYVIVERKDGKNSRKVKIDRQYLWQEEDGSISICHNAVVEELN